MRALRLVMVLASLVALTASNAVPAGAQFTSQIVMLGTGNFQEQFTMALLKDFSRDLSFIFGHVEIHTSS